MYFFNLALNRKIASNEESNKTISLLKIAVEKLKPDITYHVFNHVNGFENIFRDHENYRFFLEKYRKYISPVAETYAYCLMPNLFSSGN